MSAGDLRLVRELASSGGHLATVSTTRGDGSIHSSLVSAGVMDHPVSGAEVVAFVTYGPVKLRNLRSRSRVSATFQAGPRWVTVEGRTDLAGPDDALPGVDGSQVPELLRAVFRAAGGTHDDWDEYDRVMAEQRRVAVFVTPERIYTN